MKNKKTILEIGLYAQYYKKDITDRYMINNKSLIVTNDAIDILDKPQEQLYIEPWTKKIEKDKEIKKLNKKYEDAVADYEEQKYIINELEEWLESEVDRINKLKSPKKGVLPYGEENYYYENMILRYKEVLDKLKELKEGK